jgi:hypothetical protein
MPSWHEQEEAFCLSSSIIHCVLGDVVALVNALCHLEVAWCMSEPQGHSGACSGFQ